MITVAGVLARGTWGKIEPYTTRRPGFRAPGSIDLPLSQGPKPAPFYTCRRRWGMWARQYWALLLLPAGAGRYNPCPRPPRRYAPGSLSSPARVEHRGI